MSLSANIGIAPHLETANAVAINVFDGIITSSFCFMFKALKTISIASVPFAHPMVYLLFVKLEKLFSNSLT